MPGIVHAVVVFTTISGLPKDMVQNSFTFATDAGTPADAADGALTLLTAFYNVDLAAGVGNVPLASLMGNVIDRTKPVEVNTYTLSSTSSSVPDVHTTGTGFGSPDQVGVFTLGSSGGGADYPAQVCACLSFHSDRGALAEHSGKGPRPAERTRGRIYLGPLNTTSGATDTVENTPTASPQLTRAMVAAGKSLLTPPTAVPDLRHVVWSRKNNACTTVVGGFVDDRFDTQRRRLEIATARTSWTGP